MFFEFLRKARHKASLAAKKSPILYDILRRLSRFGEQDALYLFLREFASYNSKASVLQLGANDGIRDDPIREFVIWNSGWHAYLVEPLPDQVRDLRRNYRRQIQTGRVTIIPTAIAKSPEPITLYRVKRSEMHRFHDYVDGMITSNPGHLTNRTDLKILSSDLEEFKIKPQTLEQIFASVQASSVDLVCIDVEGMEF
jgi:FkbM family methyltransferase